MKKYFITGGSGFIGTNLINELVKAKTEVLNYDCRPPLDSSNNAYWVKGDILDADMLKTAISKFAPDFVIHLAARTECDETTTVEKGYAVNTEGTNNLLKAVKECPNVERLLITSSQFVCGPGRLPVGDCDYFPHTVYGQSKVITEALTRQAELNCTWFITRPTNIWGPYHERYTREFWRIASMGMYMHPNIPAPTRTYGYIGNVIWQMLGLLNAPHEKVCGKVFYVGDRPIQIDKWSLGFAEALSPWPTPRIPMSIMNGLASVGDMISKLSGKPFFITKNRLKSMTQDYVAPIDQTEELLGPAPWSLDDGIKITVEWYRRAKASASK